MLDVCLASSIRVGDELPSIGAKVAVRILKHHSSVAPDEHAASSTLTIARGRGRPEKTVRLSMRPSDWCLQHDHLADRCVSPVASMSRM